MSSDAITHTYMNWVRPARLVEVRQQMPQADLTAFYDLGCTIGAYTVFPVATRVDGKWRLSINQARGMHPKIRDRFDLTLECVRRLYEDSPSPLTTTLGWHCPFFDLFGDFRGYVNHFLLNDLVCPDYRSVLFSTTFDGFQQDPLPFDSTTQYRDYMARQMAFIRARNKRIAQYAAAALE